MRIVFVTEVYLPVTNGVVHVIQLASNELQKRGHTVHIIAPSPSGVHPKSNNVHYVPSLPFPGGSGYHLAFPTFSSAAQLIEKADIVHTHHPFTLGSWAQRISQKIHKPFLFTNHTQYLNYTHHIPIAGSLIKKPLSSYLAAFANNCTIVIAPAEQTAIALKDSGVTKPIQIVPNGIEIERFTKGDGSRWRTSLGIPADKTILLYTGRLAEEKNLEFLIRTVAGLKEQPHLVLVGDGPDKHRLEKLVNELGANTHIHIAGKLNYHLMPDAYAGSDIYVTASKTEVHPLTVIEAQAAGLPAIVVDAPGTAEIVENYKTGIITAATDRAFGGAIRQLLDRPTLVSEFGKNAQQTAKRFSVQASVDSLLDTYQLAKRLAATNDN